jgi:tRNA(Ile)-lysidine synthase
VSGGRDSVVLLHALLQVQRLLSLSIEVCHVNHGLRADSYEDENFVVAWCAELGVVCHVERLSPRPVGENIEAWARTHRYETFKRVMAERNLDIVLTAHNANDVAETLLMRLIANKELTSIEEFDPRRRVVRPLIEISREQINEYVSQNGLPFIEDPSNQDPTFVRNRLRHEVLPILTERFDPSMVWILSERAQSLAADSEALHVIASAVAQAIGDLEEGSPQWLDRCQSELARTPPAVQWRIVQILFTPLLGFTVGESKAQAIASVLQGLNPMLQIGSGVTLHAGREGVKILRDP